MWQIADHILGFRYFVTERHTSVRLIDQVFISKRFCYWKNALEFFREHQNSECHKVSTECEFVIPKHTTTWWI